MLPQNYVTGDYCVGTETFSIVDNERLEVLGPKEGKRKISVRMYYPVEREQCAGKEKAVYFSERKKKVLLKAYPLPRKWLKDVETAEYYKNVSHVEGKKFPLILFNHGYGIYIESNNVLCIELASHGYVVASVGHAYEAMENDYSDGSFDVYDKNINKELYSKHYLKSIIEMLRLNQKKLPPEKAYKEFLTFQDTYCYYTKGRVPEWQKDNMSVVADLKQRYVQWIDLSKGIGATGHSMGGSTAYGLCMNEEEIVCGISIDGVAYGDYAGQTMTRPFYQICKKQNYNMETTPLFHTTAPVHYAIFENMQHNGFTDMKFFVPIRAMVGKMNGLVMYKHLSNIHIKFFDMYLKKLPNIKLPSGQEDGVTYK